MMSGQNEDFKSCFLLQAEDNERREKNLEEAKKILIESDPSLPEPKTVCLQQKDELNFD